MSTESAVDGPPLIVGIGGSAGSASVTNRLLQVGLAHCERGGANTLAIAGAELAAVPIYGSDGVDADGTAARLADAVRRADAVIVATPGYHGGMSGLVKNALDHLEALRGDERPYLDGRAVGVIVSAAGWQACGTALDSVRASVHALRGWPTPFGVTVNSIEQKPDEQGHFDERVDGALAILAGQLLDFVSWRRAAAAR